MPVEITFSCQKGCVHVTQTFLVIWQSLHLSYYISELIRILAVKSNAFRSQGRTPLLWRTWLIGATRACQECNAKLLTWANSTISQWAKLVISCLWKHLPPQTNQPKIWHTLLSAAVQTRKTSCQECNMSGVQQVEICTFL